MKKTLLQFTFIFALFALLGAGCVFGGGGNSKNQTPDLEQSKPIVIDTKQYSTDSYKSKYGYEFTYPTYYKEDNNYSIWTAKNEAVHLLDEWGINKGQESIFVISIYPKENKSDVLSYYGHKVFDEEVLINGEIANKIKVRGVYDGILFESQKYIFIIYSTFTMLTDTPEYKEYTNILNSIHFVE